MVLDHVRILSIHIGFDLNSNLESISPPFPLQEVINKTNHGSSLQLQSDPSCLTASLTLHGLQGNKREHYDYVKQMPSIYPTPLFAAIFLQK